jgi:hypothetical protein
MAQTSFGHVFNGEGGNVSRSSAGAFDQVLEQSLELGSSYRLTSRLAWASKYAKCSVIGELR